LILFSTHTRISFKPIHAIAVIILAWSGMSMASTTLNEPVITPSQEELALEAMTLIGTPYVYGGEKPLVGMDCSGFVKYVVKQVLNIDLPRTAASQAKVGEKIAISDLEIGDLIFFNTQNRAHSHMGIYLGNDQFIHAPRKGKKIHVTALSGYWSQRIDGARRLPTV
jgi:cell wall-associated NlpC family hydrolase